MAKCSLCGRPAIYISRISGVALCEKHFLEYFDRKVRRTIRKYKLFKPKDHIAVAVSGGKDSLGLLHYLYKLSRRVPGWKITALLVDEGIRGYREYTVKRLEKAASELGVDYVIVRFKDELGFTLDEIVKIAAERGLPYKPCTFCGVFRRYLLNKKAREIGSAVIATGHNLDDVIQTYMMNIIDNDWTKIARLGPVSGPAHHPKFVRKVKPFYEMLEKETTIYAILNGFYEGFEECPYARFGVRWTVRKMLNQLEEQYPGVKYSILQSLLTAIDMLNKLGIGEGEVETCAICGEPSAHPVCRACMLKIELGILKLSPEKLAQLSPSARKMIESGLKLYEKRNEQNKQTNKSSLGIDEAVSFKANRQLFHGVRLSAESSCIAKPC